MNEEEELKRSQARLQKCLHDLGSLKVLMLTQINNVMGGIMETYEELGENWIAKGPQDE